MRSVADIRKLLLAGADKVSINSAAVANPDFVAEAGIDWKSYGKLIGERPSAQRVSADRKASVEARA